MVINPIVGVYIPIIRIPIKGGMTIPNIRSFDCGTCSFQILHAEVPCNNPYCYIGFYLCSFSVMLYIYTCDILWYNKPRQSCIRRELKYTHTRRLKHEKGWEGSLFISRCLRKKSLTSKETIKKHLIYFEKGRILFNLVFDVLYEAIKPVSFLSDVPPRVFYSWQPLTTFQIQKYEWILSKTPRLT